jgi:hypothetical protein
MNPVSAMFFATVFRRCHLGRCQFVQSGEEFAKKGLGAISSVTHKDPDGAGPL